MACHGFSDVQGGNGWAYQSRADGQWTNLPLYFSFGVGGDQHSWLGFEESPDGDDSGFLGLIGPRYIVPGWGHDTARVWRAPKDGVVDITSWITPASSTPHVLTLTQNGQPVWGPVTLDGSGSPLTLTVADLTVVAGDLIRFEVQGLDSLDLSNALAWDANIDYHGESPLPGPPPLLPTSRHSTQTADSTPTDPSGATTTATSPRGCCKPAIGPSPGPG